MKQVVYVDLHGHIIEVTSDGHGSWHHTDLTHLINAPVSSTDILVGYEWSSQFAKQIVFLDTNPNPHIHELLLRHGSSWQHTDLTKLTGAPELV